MKDVNNLPPLMAEGKNSKKRSTRGKSFGYQVLGFGAGGGAAPFIEATGGTESTSGDFKIHTFTGPGTFCVSGAGTPGGADTVSYMVVAGGGGAGYFNGGGGGAGGYRESKAATDCYTASPLNATSGPTYNLPVSVQGYPITVGAGGTAAGAGPGNRRGYTGATAIFSSITSAGGGGAGGGTAGGCQGADGGSGGGGGGTTAQPGGCGNIPPVAPPQGNQGEDTTGATGGTGGGATVAGGTNGGAGAGTGINPSTCVGTPGPSPSLRYFSGGGGGSAPPSPGGVGGGGPGVAPGTATANTGGGQGGDNATGNGGSGIVIIRYKYQ